MRPDIVARAGIQGVVLAQIDPRGPAGQAGLVPYNQRTGELGDVITAVNGRPTPTLSVMMAELDRVGIDNQAELSVNRNAERERERRVKVRVIDLRR